MKKIVSPNASPEMIASLNQLSEVMNGPGVPKSSVASLDYAIAVIGDATNAIRRMKLMLVAAGVSKAIVEAAIQH